MDLLDAALEPDEDEFECEAAIEKAGELTEKEIRRADETWRRIFEKLGIAEEMAVLAELERTQEERRRRAEDVLVEHVRKRDPD